MNYCTGCGVWTRLDYASKLCDPCWDAWPGRGTGRSAADNPPPAEGIT